MESSDVLTLLALGTTSMAVAVLVGGSAMVFCGKKKPSRKQPPPSLKKSQTSGAMSNRVSMTQPLSQPQLLTGTAGSSSNPPAGAAAGTPSGTGPPTNPADKAGPQSDASKQPEQSKGDEKNSVEKGKEGEKKPDASGGADKKSSADKNQEQSKENKDKDAPKDPSTPASPAPPAPAAPATPSAPKEGEKKDAKEPPPPPRGMEIHKSMKVRNKKKPALADAAAKPAAAGAPVPDKPPEGKKSGHGDLKHTDGDDDDEDDDETLRGVTSLKIDTKVPFSVDEGMA